MEDLSDVLRDLWDGSIDEFVFLRRNIYIYLNHTSWRQDATHDENNSVRIFQINKPVSYFLIALCSRYIECFSFAKDP